MQISIFKNSLVLFLSLICFSTLGHAQTVSDYVPQDSVLRIVAREVKDGQILYREAFTADILRIDTWNLNASIHLTNLDLSTVENSLRTIYQNYDSKKNTHDLTLNVRLSGDKVIVTTDYSIPPTAMKDFLDYSLGALPANISSLKFNSVGMGIKTNISYELATKIFQLIKTYAQDPQIVSAPREKELELQKQRVEKIAEILKDLEKDGTLADYFNNGNAYRSTDMVAFAHAFATGVLISGFGYGLYSNLPEESAIKILKDFLNVFVKGRMGPISLMEKPEYDETTGKQKETCPDDRIKFLKNSDELSAPFYCLKKSSGPTRIIDFGHYNTSSLDMLNAQWFLSYVKAADGKDYEYILDPTTPAYDPVYILVEKK